MQNMEKLRPWAMRVKAGPTVRQAKQAQHWDDRKSQSRWVTRRIGPRRSGRTWQERMWNRLNREEQMTSAACRLVRPEAAAQWSPAHNRHVSVLPSGPLARGSSSSGGALVRLEPCEGKLSRTVLRGARARNRPRLPDSTCGRAKTKFLSAKVKSCCSEGESPSGLAESRRNLERKN
jgi:hypothetical protein